MDEWLAWAAFAVLSIDAGLFFAVFWMLRRGIFSIQQNIVEMMADPESLRLFGEGAMRGWRNSAHGTMGKDAQVSKASERAVLADILESWMSANLPMINMIEQQIPDIKAIVRKNPEAAFVILQKFGPMIERRMSEGIEKAASGVGGMMR
jgi:hypothetical protein